MKQMNVFTLTSLCSGPILMNFFETYHPESWSVNPLSSICLHSHVNLGYHGFLLCCFRGICSIPDRMLMYQQVKMQLLKC